MRLALLVRVSLALATLAGLALAAPPAAARCMQPGPVLAPASGAVPPMPVLRLLVPTGVDHPPLPRVLAHRAGKQVPVTVTADTAVADLHTYRVVVTASAPGPLDVQLLDDEGAITRTWTFTIDPAWRPPATTTPTIAVTHQSSRWTCSYQRTRNLQFTGTAAAYRVSFTDNTPPVIVPADPTAYFRSEPTSTTAVDLALGHVSCLGHTLAWSTTRRAKVHALWPDGSEPLLTPDPLLLAPP